ncbi:unnamed protein product, partial [Trichogramma brassicae]
MSNIDAMKNLYKNCGEKKIDFRKIGEAKMLDEKFQRVIYRIFNTTTAYNVARGSSEKKMRAHRLAGAFQCFVLNSIVLQQSKSRIWAPYHRRISILDNFLDTPGHVLLRVLLKIAQRRAYMRSTNTLFSKNDAIIRLLTSRGKLLLRGQRECPHLPDIYPTSPSARLRVNECKSFSSLKYLRHIVFPYKARSLSTTSPCSSSYDPILLYRLAEVAMKPHIDCIR